MQMNPPPGIVIPPNVQTAVNTFIAKAPGDAAQLQANLEDWFNTGMDRVSGWYKRRTQWIILGLGLAIAIGLNADTVKIAQSLANDSSLRKGLVAAAQARAGQPLTDPNAATATQVQIKQYTDQLNSIGLPFGWREADLPPVPRTVLEPPPLPPPEIHAKDSPHARAAKTARRGGRSTKRAKGGVAAQGSKPVGHSQAARPLGKTARKPGKRVKP